MESVEGSGEASGQLRSWLGIGVKLTLGVIAILVALGGATVFVVTGEMRSTLHEQSRSKGFSIARGLSATAAQLLVDMKVTRLSETVEGLMTVGGLAYIIVSDADGKFVVSMFTQPDGTVAPAEEVPEALKAGLLQVGEARITEIEAKKLGAGDPHAGTVLVPGMGEVLEVNIPIGGGELGTAHVGMNLGVVEAEVSAMTRALTGLFVIFVLVGGLLTMVVMRRLLKPLTAVQEVLQHVSDGRLDARAEVTSRDEVAELAGSANSMITRLRDIVTGVRGAGIQVSEASEEILATAKTQEQGAAEQTASIEELLRSMEAMNETARTISATASGLQKLSEQMTKNVQGGEHSLNAAQNGIAEIVRQNDLVTQRITDLYERSQSIISVIDIIEGISDRLDLLALNAALEGSRAGEVGRGFSLVAQEMRRLAENVIGSTKEIKDTVQEIHRLTQASLDASRASTQKSNAGATDMEMMTASVQGVFSLIQATAMASQQILVIAQQQLTSSQQMVNAMQEIATISNEGLTATQQVTRASTDLTELAASLRERVAVFQLDGTHQAHEEPVDALAPGVES